MDMVNSKPLLPRLADLKGKVVVVHFFAFWVNQLRP